MCGSGDGSARCRSTGLLLMSHPCEFISQRIKNPLKRSASSKVLKEGEVLLKTRKTWKQDPFLFSFSSSFFRHVFLRYCSFVCAVP